MEHVSPRRGAQASAHGKLGPPTLRHVIAAMFASVVQGCNPATAVSSPPSPNVAVPPIEHAARDVIATMVHEALDPATDPCVDFYAFACGGWLANTEIPRGRTEWRRGFEEAGVRVRKILRRVLDDDDDPRDSALASARIMYRVCMDEDASDGAGLGAVQPLLAQLERIADLEQLMVGLAELHRLGIPVGFRIQLEPDPEGERIYTARVWPGELGLADPDWYFADSSGADDPKLGMYIEGASRVFHHFGAAPDEARSLAAAVVELERNLARARPPSRMLRNPVETDHRMRLAEMAQLTNPLPFEPYREVLELRDDASFNVAVPTHMQSIAHVIAEADLRVVGAWLRLRLLDALAQHLPRSVRPEVLALRSVGNGTPVDEPERWETCVAATEAVFGSRLGQYFVEHAFEGNEQELVTELLMAIRDEFRTTFDEIGWMDASTRSAAKNKLESMTYNVGWPHRFPAALPSEPASNDHLANVLAGRLAQRSRSLASVGRDVKQAPWGIRAQTVNAYYRPSLNQVVVPAGILQPPFFDRSYPPAMNYGALGTILGHEISHAFDDRGRRHDADGRLRDWWSRQTAREFENRAACVEHEYAQAEVSPGVRLDGGLVLGEGIADRGGLEHAYRAWRARSLPTAEDDAVPGFTGEQLFFVSYAQIWCSKTNPERERAMVRSRRHPPPRIRVNAAVSSSAAFSQAFHCSEASPMHELSSCELW